MTKQHNMGRRSFLEQDVEYEQTLNGLKDDIGDQPTRPSLGKQQPDKTTGKNRPNERPSRGHKPTRLM